MSSKSDSQTIPPNAFLIVNGDQVFPINQPVINIGRRSGNHIVIDDTRVSRNHAQLRVARGQFVLLDLNSTGGTSINGKRIKQAILHPGDVISLAGVPIIFGQGKPGQYIPSSPRPQTTRTGPTDAVDLDSRDNYLNWFDTQPE